MSKEKFELDMKIIKTSGYLMIRIPKTTESVYDLKSGDLIHAEIEIEERAEETKK